MTSPWMQQKAREYEKDPDKFMNEWSKAGKELSKPKVHKGIKSFSQLLKGFGPFGEFITTLPGISDIFRSLYLIFKPFEPFLKIIAGLLSKLFGEILIQVFPILKPLIDKLIEFMPTFAEIGVIVGGVIVKILEAIFPILDALAPLLPIIAAGLAMLMIGGFIPLITVIYGVGVVITSVVDFISAIISTFTGLPRTQWLASWNELMLPILGSVIGAIPELMVIAFSPTEEEEEEEEEYTPDYGGAFETLPRYQTGGTVPGIGAQLSIVEGGEEVVPPGRIDELIDLMERQLFYTRKLYQLKEEKWD